MKIIGHRGIRLAVLRLGRSASAALVALVAVCALASASGASAKGVPYDFVVGAASLPIPNFPTAGVTTTEQIAIVALDGRNGPTGEIWFRSPLASIRLAKANVTCISVEGSLARVGGTFEKPFTYLATTINQFAVIIRDGSPDAIHPVVFRDIPRPPGFSPCNIEQPLLPIGLGNYVLHDGNAG